MAQTDAAEAYSAAVERLSTLLSRSCDTIDWSDGPIQWRFFRRNDATLPHQGWKIHLSASAAESAALLRTIALALVELDVSCKVPRRISDVAFLNSGDAGIEQLGKVITIYPRDVAHARQVCVRLDELWPVSRGPEVQTDLHLRPGSAVSFRYGVFGTGPVTVSSTGIYHFALIAADGSGVPDARSLDGRQPPCAPAPPLAGCPPTPPPVKVNEVVEIGGHSYLVLDQLARSARATTFLAADVDRLQTVVLKVGRPGVAGDVSGVDIRDLLKKEYLILTQLDGRDGIAPRALQWADGEWPMLVMEDFRGTSLSDLPRARRIECLPLLARAIAQVHAAGIVHGDIKLENAILRGERVGLIDFELAERAGDRMRAGGTRGHLEPRVDGPGAARSTRDVFALAGCIVQSVLDLPPALLPAGTGRFQALLHNENAPLAAQMVADFARADPESRPTAADAATTLAAYARERASMVPVRSETHQRNERAWQRRACVDAALLAGDYARSGPDGTHWRNTHFMRAFDCEAINIGAAGIVLGLITIDSALGGSRSAAPICAGAQWLAGRPADGNAAGMFTGNAGVAVALAVAGKRCEQPAFIAAARRRFETAAADRRETDLFSGSAGVVWAACILSRVLQAAWPLEVAAQSFAHLSASAGSMAGIPIWTGDAAPEKAFIGCAHGTAGVAMALACWGRSTDDPRCIDTAVDAFKRIAAHGRTASEDGLKMTPAATRHHAVGNWCHGVAGYLWAMLQGVGDDPALRSEIDWAVSALDGAAATGTPTYCHGLAGQLELWRMLAGVARFRTLAQERAVRVARALRIVHHKVGGRCAWIADDPDIVTPDLWIGFLGPATALAMHLAGVDAPLLSAQWLTSCATALRSAPLDEMSPTPHAEHERSERAGRARTSRRSHFERHADATRNIL